MKLGLQLHRPSTYTFGAPGLLGPTIASLLGLILAYGFGDFALAVWNGNLPSWAGRGLTATIESPGTRAVLMTIGAIQSLLALVVAIGYGDRVRLLLRHRLGQCEVREIEGPCRLVHEEPGLWTLHLELRQGSIPFAWPVMSSRHDEGGNDLLFRVDEGSAATLSRLFHPGDLLRLSWIDLPTRVGGPILLHARSAEDAAATISADGATTRAA